MPSILYNYTPHELQELLDESNGYSDVLRKVGINPKGGNPKTLKKIIEEYNLDITKLNKNRSMLFSRNAYKTKEKIEFKLTDILNGKHPNYQSSKLLKRLVNEGYKEYKCEKCGITEWLNNPISLQLHHKDGNHTNNKLDNLIILCPNCHTQTDSYGGKTSRKNESNLQDKPRQNSVDKTPRIKKELPLTREELKYKIRKYPFVQIGKEYGISDNAIRKWCDKYNLPRSSKIIKSYSDEEWENI